MKPPICSACGKDFRSNAQSGALVAFADAKKLEDGRTGHPPGHAWFCSDHVHLARQYSEFDYSTALDKIKRTSRQSSLFLLIVPTILTGLSAYAGSIVGVKLLGVTGLIAGGLASGLLGVLLSAAVSLRAGWISPDRARPAVGGGTVGFLVSLVVTITGTATTDSLIVPLLSILLVGAGFLRGSKIKKLP